MCNTSCYANHVAFFNSWFSRIFWFGDLNYRLYLEDNFARHLIRKQDWKALQEFDQLQKELEEGGVFEGWKEGDIEFAPTYKYSSSTTNRYCGSLPNRSGEKQRTPAWYVHNNHSLILGFVYVSESWISYIIFMYIRQLFMYENTFLFLSITKDYVDENKQTKVTVKRSCLHQTSGERLII